MDRRVVVESEAAYRYGRRLFQGGKVTWYTTSPWLLDKLPGLGEKVDSLEQDVDPGEAHKIGELAVRITEGIIAFLDNRLDNLPAKVMVGKALGESLFRSLTALYYKAWLLGKLVDRDNERTYVIGNWKWNAAGRFAVLLSRNLTLFAIIAAHSGRQDLQVIPFEEGDWEKNAAKKMEKVGRSNWERFMNALNMNANAFSFKLYRRIWENASFFVRSGAADVFLFKHNPLIEEAFLPLKLRGLKIRILPPLRLAGLPEDESRPLGSKDQFEEYYLKVFGEAGEGDKSGTLMATATKLAASLTWDALRFARSEAKGVEEFVKEEIARRSRRGKAVVLTNGLSLPQEVMFYYCCKHEGIPVYLVSHGVSAGLSRYHYRLSKIMSFSHGDAFFGYSEGECRGEIEHHVTGAPHSERIIGRKRIQKYFARRHLRLDRKKRCIMYVANLYSNNAVDLPYGGTNDYYEHYLKKAVISEVFAKLRDQCIVKLYPAQRYGDPDPILHEKPPDHIKVIQWSEFRYLRSACDVIIVDMAQSAFGWAWSSGMPLILLDTPYYPLLPEVHEMLKKAIFVISTSEDGWTERLLGLLRLPENELLRMWQEKNPVRCRMGKDRIMGPKRGIGEVIARVVHENLRCKCDEVPT